MISFPMVPVDSISERCVMAIMIQTIQIGVMAMAIPPRSFVFHRAVIPVNIIVRIFGGESHIVVRS